jgi:hypothetical protein
MVDIAAAYPSKYGKAADYPTPQKVTVSHVEIEELGNEEKPVLYLKDAANQSF